MLTRETLMLDQAQVCSPVSCVAGWPWFHPPQEIRRWPFAASQDPRGSNCSGGWGKPRPLWPREQVPPFQVSSKPEHSPWRKRALWPKSWSLRFVQRLPRVDRWRDSSSESQTGWQRLCTGSSTSPRRSSAQLSVSRCSKFRGLETRGLGTLFPPPQDPPPRGTWSSF